MEAETSRGLRREDDVAGRHTHADSPPGSKRPRRNHERPPVEGEIRQAAIRVDAGDFGIDHRACPRRFAEPGQIGPRGDVADRARGDHLAAIENQQM